MHFQFRTHLVIVWRTEFRKATFRVLRKHHIRRQRYKLTTGYTETPSTNFFAKQREIAMIVNVFIELERKSLIRALDQKVLHKKYLKKYWTYWCTGTTTAFGIIFLYTTKRIHNVFYTITIKIYIVESMKFYTVIVYIARREQYLR